jgi:hypothetical protein
MDRSDLSDPKVREAIAGEATRGAQRLLMWLAVGAVVLATVLGPVWFVLTLR